MPRRYPPLKERFESRVDRRSEAECWVWKSGHDSHGYGAIRAENGKPDRAHRVAWRIAHGAIPDGLDVLHHCDNPPCCNPSHLFLGTQADNNADKTRKGRASKPPPRDQHPQAKLTSAQVAEIVSSESTLSQPKAARKYGVAESLIWKIRRDARLAREREAA